MKAVILVGPPASGKTTLAKLMTEDRDGWLHIELDQFRISMTGSKKEFFKSNNLYEDSAKIKELRDRQIAVAAAQGLNIVESSCNINKKHFDILVNKFKELGYEVRVNVMHVQSLGWLTKRNNLRNEDDVVPIDTLRNMYMEYKDNCMRGAFKL